MRWLVPLSLAVALVAPVPQAGASGPTCGGKPATIVGTRGYDVIEGTTGPDVIVALRGVDVVLGHRGNDVICGGDGRDRLLGQLGHDTLYGERGQDQLLDVGGWTGPPTAADSDLVYGGSGKDQIWTISPLSRIHGQSGADTITDTNCLGTAHLAGGAGDDTFASWQQESDQRNCSSVAAFVGDDCFGGPGEDVAIADLKDATAGIESVTRR